MVSSSLLILHFDYFFTTYNQTLYTITDTFLLHLKLSVLERDMLKREELDNADIFNFHLWCEDAEFDLYVDKLAKQLCKKSPQFLIENTLEGDR